MINKRSSSIAKGLGSASITDEGIKIEQKPALFHVKLDNKVPVIDSITILYCTFVHYSSLFILPVRY